MPGSSGAWNRCRSLRSASARRIWQSIPLTGSHCALSCSQPTSAPRSEGYAGAVDAADNPVAAAVIISRSSPLRSLPVAVRGIVSTNDTAFGHL